MITLNKGRYAARHAESDADLRAAQALRYRVFARDGSRLNDPDGLDRDRFDAECVHVLIEDTRTGRLACCFRMMPLEGGAQISRSYSAQYYELSALAGFEGRLLEMGRFCIDPEARNADVLRVAWGAMTRFVDETGVELLFGCTSFEGTDAAAYHDAFAMLRDRHLAPGRWLPRVKAPNVFRFANRLRRSPDATRAQRTMPPLLRTYLSMGGWVSDHAVIDAHMNTLHVFTGVEIGRIPPARKRLLRAVAG
ncbi:GNAT family N-acetyltransferase [Pseudaestuariivita atlantica]|uniref:L-ornithine N(alpha)-acyltransferase n=1 Tax=Pseudaestuariivita atlantica TaxID=1317121 RepID=A0A0L1JVT6_9RHOB|nr:GNAT family N-acetyltransferase [Pseudaestuariivita atlantica]KNG95488.1 ornithine-acyl-ACP acyltransferase [Pseudaestuariivita atlantica]